VKKLKAAATMEGWTWEEVFSPEGAPTPSYLLRIRKKGMRPIAVVWTIGDDGKLSSSYSIIKGAIQSGVKNVAAYITGALTEEDIQVAWLAAHDAARERWEAELVKIHEIPERFLPKRRTRS
jgi:hypothetical protein